jgi:16S rRNA (cytosine1402-N4)-methyltransferase
VNDDPSAERVFHHSPVMGSEIVRLFAAVPAGVIVDATLGGGGHAALLLAARPDCSLLGLDRDPAALTAAGAILAPFGDRVTLRHARFDRLATVMTDLDLPAASGVLFDLGVSSPQLDHAERGFSYRNEGPLDMRMDPTEPWSADDVVNGYPVDELTRILLDHADERFANRIARAIVAARPIESTAELAAVVRDAIPAPARRRGGHPAKRTFQAIRIEVNGELGRRLDGAGGDDGTGDPVGEALIGVVEEDPRQLVDGIPVDDIVGRPWLGGIHAHVEGAVVAIGEPPLGSVELG